MEEQSVAGTTSISNWLFTSPTTPFPGTDPPNQSFPGADPPNQAFPGQDQPNQTFTNSSTSFSSNPHHHDTQTSPTFSPTSPSSFEESRVQGSGSLLGFSDMTGMNFSDSGLGHLKMGSGFSPNLALSPPIPTSPQETDAHMYPHTRLQGGHKVDYSSSYSPTLMGYSPLGQGQPPEHISPTFGSPVPKQVHVTLFRSISSNRGSVITVKLWFFSCLWPTFIQLAQAVQYNYRQFTKWIIPLWNLCVMYLVTIQNQ